jgi:hypothetical protein
MDDLGRNHDEVVKAWKEKVIETDLSVEVCAQASNDIYIYYKSRMTTTHLSYYQLLINTPSLIQQVRL